MNNAYLNEDEEVIDIAPVYRERIEDLTAIIEALQNISGSSYWKVLKQFIFDVELDKAKSRLAKEKDTTEMFRLQGEIKKGEQYDLDKLILKYRNELTSKKGKITS